MLLIGVRALASGVVACLVCGPVMGFGASAVTGALRAFRRALVGRS